VVDELGRVEDHILAPHFAATEESPQLDDEATSEDIELPNR